MKEVVNTKIKFRELFRPFAPVVNAEDAPRYFSLGKTEGQYPQRFMLMVSPADPARAHEIPAVVHMGTARLQTVYREDHPLYHDLIHQFGQATGVPVLLNTSFNLRGEPIVSTPGEAFSTFSKSDIDVLAMGPFLVRKNGSAPKGVAARTPSPAPDGLDRLVCPACRGRVVPGGAAPSTLSCAACRREFPIDDGIPLLYWPTDAAEVDRVSEIVKGFYEENPFPGYEDIDSADTLAAKARRGVFAKLLDDQTLPESTVLEVGCGTGQLSNFLGVRGRTVYGADLCLNSLKLARHFRSRNLLHTVHFVQMNLFRPVFADASFDLVISNGVLHHTDDPAGGFRSIARLVRPGGHIVIGLYNRYGRVWTDLRRTLFKLSGNRFRSLDPYLSDPQVDEHKKRIWFADQYMSPARVEALRRRGVWLVRSGRFRVHERDPEADAVRADGPVRTAVRAASARVRHRASAVGAEARAHRWRGGRLLRDDRTAEDLARALGFGHKVPENAVDRHAQARPGRAGRERHTACVVPGNGPPRKPVVDGHLCDRGDVRRMEPDALRVHGTPGHDEHIALPEQRGTRHDRLHPAALRIELESPVPHVPQRARLARASVREPRWRRVPRCRAAQRHPPCR